MIRSKICTEGDFHQDWFRKWVGLLGCNPADLHRKVWEWVMIAQALHERGLLSPGKKGIGYAVGTEPMPSLFASFGCEILATDLGRDTEAGKVWSEGSNVIARDLGDLWRGSIVNAEAFNRLVKFRNVDMNHIPPDLRSGQFDFAWSSCSFEHLGSIRRGIDFILDQMACLKRGGVAVHTTEFNLSSNDDTLEDVNITLFRRRDIEELLRELTHRGHHVEELDTSMGYTAADYFVDVFPYTHNPHLRLKVYDWVCTSIILVITRGR